MTWATLIMNNAYTRESVADGRSLRCGLVSRVEQGKSSNAVEELLLGMFLDPSAHLAELVSHFLLPLCLFDDGSGLETSCCVSVCTRCEFVCEVAGTPQDLYLQKACKDLVDTPWECARVPHGDA